MKVEYIQRKPSGVLATASWGLVPPRRRASIISEAFWATSWEEVSISSARTAERVWPRMRLKVSVARQRMVVVPVGWWMMYSGWGETRKSWGDVEFFEEVVEGAHKYVADHYICGLEYGHYRARVVHR